MNIMFASDIHGSAYYCQVMLSAYNRRDLSPHDTVERGEEHAARMPGLLSGVLLYCIPM